MSMNKYISGIINCLDTVPSLKKQLVRAFKKVEEDVNILENGELYATTSLIEGASYSTESNGNVLLKKGNMVFLMLGITSLTADANAAICTIPEGLRPAISQTVCGIVGGSARQIVITKTGIVRCTSSATNNQFFVQAFWNI